MLAKKTKETTTLPHSQFLSLVYHDLFGYPLTREETWFWQIGKAEQPRHLVEAFRGFYCLAGRGDLVFQRAARTHASLGKFKIAQKAAGVLACLPTIRMVGVTGGLSMGNADQDSDIDFLIITTGDTLWITRLLAFVFLKFLGIKLRRFGDLEVQDKLCLNLWIDEKNMDFSKRKDVYTAHEILQTKVLLNKNDTYQRFLKKNLWVKEIFPNGFASRMKRTVLVRQRWPSVIALIFRLLDRPAYFFQRLYMRSKRTRERIEKGRALFHPLSWQEDIPWLFLSRLEGIKKNRASFSFPHITD